MTEDIELKSVMSELLVKLTSIDKFIHDMCLEYMAIKIELKKLKELSNENI